MYFILCLLVRGEQYLCQGERITQGAGPWLYVLLRS